jgi:hypothetical protein
MYADMVRLRIIHKAHGLDVFVAQEQSLTNAMHSIHHPTITRKDNGELEVTILHETRMLDDIPAGQLGRPFVGPVRLIDFSN